MYTFGLESLQITITTLNLGPSRLRSRPIELVVFHHPRPLIGPPTRNPGRLINYQWKLLETGSPGRVLYRFPHRSRSDPSKRKGRRSSPLSVDNRHGSTTTLDLYRRKSKSRQNWETFCHGVTGTPITIPPSPQRTP